jgi:hypothetical protein
MVITKALLKEAVQAIQRPNVEFQLLLLIIVLFIVLIKPT